MGRGFLSCILGRRQQDSLTFSVHEYRRCKNNLNRGALGFLLWQGFGEAQFAPFTKLRDRAKQTLRRFRSTQRRPQLHHGLIPIAGRSRVEQTIRRFLQLLPTPRLADVAVNCAETSKNTRHVAVEDSKFFAVCDAQNRSCRVISDTRQGERILQARWKLSSALRHDLLRGFLQVARAAVIAKSGPET